MTDSTKPGAHARRSLIDDLTDAYEAAAAKLARDEADAEALAARIKARVKDDSWSGWLNAAWEELASREEPTPTGS